jgi:tetratricopeptide (TPR) repeat protein
MSPRVIGIIILVVVVVAAVVGIVTAVGRMADAVARRTLPPVPALEGHNQATETLILDAAAEAVRHPRSVESLGRLAEIYHAHLYLDEARLLYRLLEDRDPDRFRWAYLHGVVAEVLQDWDDAERAYLRATRLAPGDAETWARLSTLQLTMGRLEPGKRAAQRAYEIDPSVPQAALAASRLAVSEQDWERVVEILSPVIEVHPRYSDAHKQIARAYAMMGDSTLTRAHRGLGEFGDEMDRDLLDRVYERAVPAILDGDPERAPPLVEDRCVRCHTLDRTFERPDADRFWWGRVVRRMQRLDGKGLLTDQEAADVVAYLASDRAR